MKNTKRLLALLCFITCIGYLPAQIAFEETFEAQTTGLDLTTVGYQLSQSSTYTGTVTAVVAESGDNKFARMVANVNASAQMQIARTVDVEPGKSYRFEVDSKGPFKRQLRVYTMTGDLLSSSPDYKPATDPEKTAWKTMNTVFTLPSGMNQVQVGFFHYWSGTIDLDNLKVIETTRQTAYYVSSAGDDANEGTIDAPWKSLDKISAQGLLAGDTVLFERGDRFDGHFVVNGSGDVDNPILITAYGTGAKPIITGEVGAAGGGDHEEAILVENQDNLIFDGLEVQNERVTSRNGVDDTDAYGIYVLNSGNQIMRNITFRNMSFKNVFAVQPILERDDFDAIQVSGLGFFSTKNTQVGQEKHIRDVLIEDCFFGNLQRFGIQFKHGGGNNGVGNDSLNRNMNLLIRNNEFSYNGGTGVLPNRTYNCLIENNLFDHPGASTDPRMPGRGSSIWNINAINTIMQYNMCLSTRGYLDSFGIHIDNNNVNTFVQYNYMEDCEGGFVEILRGNKNAVYRFNVSVNDGFRYNPTWTTSNKTIWVNSVRHDPATFDLCDSVFIHNNTVVINKPFTSGITETSLVMDADNLYVYNNMFTSTNGGIEVAGHYVVRGSEVGNEVLISHNLFEGNISQAFITADAAPQQEDPAFNGTGPDQYAYQLQANSPAIDNGLAITGPVVQYAGQGIFKDVPAYPTVDFFGNPIDLSTGTPNIGACNAKNGEIATSSVDFAPTEQDHWLIYPQPADAKIHFVRPGASSGEITIRLTNLKGQVVQEETISMSPLQQKFEIDVKPSLANGIYFLGIEDSGVTHSRRIVLYR